MEDLSHGLGEFAESISGPPWILGARGCARDAPENTISGLKLALAAGLDGFSYDVRSCASGEPVLMADERLERTTDGTGLLFDRSLPELFSLDAGAWFSKRYTGELVPLLDEVFEYFGAEHREAIHWMELRSSESLPEVLLRIGELGRKLSLRISSRSREVCLEVRDAGLTAVLIGEVADRDAFQFVRDERIGGFATTMTGWRTAELEVAWPCERWGLLVEAPEDLVLAGRLPLFGFTTREPARALAYRALLKLAPNLETPPLRATPLSVEPGGIAGVRASRPAKLASDRAGELTGEWTGTWTPRIELENPFPFPVRVKLGLRVRRGAFEVDGLPVEEALAPREARSFAVRVVGGSWSPGGDPVVLAIVEWDAGAGRRAGKLLWEAPLVRIRTISLEGVARRLVLLKENPRDVDASLIARRHGNDLLVSIENPGELNDPHILVRVADRTLRGGQGLRVRLPLQPGPSGIPFSAGIEGWLTRNDRQIRALRRWAGGLPQDGDSGDPGRIVTL